MSTSFTRRRYVTPPTGQAATPKRSTSFRVVYTDAAGELSDTTIMVPARKSAKEVFEECSIAYQGEVLFELIV